MTIFKSTLRLAKRENLIRLANYLKIETSGKNYNELIEEVFKKVNISDFPAWRIY